MQKPKKYQPLSFVFLEPVKRKFCKPYWSVRTNISSGSAATKEQANRLLQSFVANATKTDQEIYEELIHSWAGDYIRNPWNYTLKKDVYVCNSDKHEWIAKDEVDYLYYLIKKLGKEVNVL